MYFEKTETSVIKYRVEIDIEALKELRETIITNCSIRRKKEIKNTNRIVLFSLRYECQKGKNRAITYQVVGEQEYFDGPNEDILDIQYVEYTFPPIITYIDEVLKGNQTNLDLLLHPTMPEQQKQKDDTEALQRLQTINLSGIHDAQDIEATIQELQEIQENMIALKEHQELNKNIIPASAYFNAIRECIHLIKIDEIDLETYTRMEEFQYSDKVKTLS